MAASTTASSGRRMIATWAATTSMRARAAMARKESSWHDEAASTTSWTIESGYSASTSSVGGS